MDQSLDISRLESEEKIVKSLAKVAIFSATTSVIVLIYGFMIPEPVIFLSIILIPIAVTTASNLIKRIYQRKIEFLLNDLRSEEFADNMSNTYVSTSKQSNYPNSEYLRIRGSDEKGPAFGNNNESFSTHGKRVDAMANRDYDDIKSTSTGAEKMIRIADEIQSEISSKLWDKAESKDSDLLEAGVDSLGELLKTGWFEKNKQDGAVERLYQENKGNQI